MPALVALGVGLLVGWLAGGRVDRLATYALRFEVAVIALFLVQGLLRGRLPGMEHAPLAATMAWAVTCVVLSALMVVNWRTPGAAIVAFGLLLNVVVVLANSAMPIVLYGDSAAQHASILSAAGTSRGFYSLAGPSTVTSWLSDAMPLRSFGGTVMFSVGDVALVVGVACMIVALMCEPNPVPRETLI